MADKEPVVELESQFSSDGASPTAWAEARKLLEGAAVYWLSTVRPDGRPHVTPVVAVWLEDVLYFATGPSERKARNLEENAHCVVTTGVNVLEGLDVVVEGEAERVSDEARLRRVADRYASKYGPPFTFTVRDGGFYPEDGQDAVALVYQVTPTKAFGFGKGESYSQTRWHF